jgi:hypothetical protein
LGGGDEFLVHASVQARTGKGKAKTEGSHLLLREVSFGGTYVYDLDNIPQGLKGALVYCAAQVSVTPAIYNRTDQLLEEPEPTLRAYLALIRRYIRKEEDSLEMRKQLFFDICRLFQNALNNARTYADDPKTSSTKREGASLIVDYRLALMKFVSRWKLVTAKSTEDLMYAIRVKGGWEVKGRESWGSMRSRMDFSDLRV